MRKLLNVIKKGRWFFIISIALVLAYTGFHFLNNRVSANSFFEKYNVLAVTGDDLFTDSAITLNGKIIKEAEDDWTSVLPIPNSLEYILMTSSYSKGHNIQCGDKTIPKRVEASNLGENEWCIHHNGKNIVSTTAANYFPYDKKDIVYEFCLKNGYYEGINEGSGFNSCARRGLFLNDKQIAITEEKMNVSPLSNKTMLEDASSFNYYPSKKLGNLIIYSTNEGTYSYDIATEKTTAIRVPNAYQTKLDDMFVADDGRRILVEEESILYQNTHAFLGKIEDEGRTYTNVYSARYADGYFYILRMADARDNEKGSSLTKVFTYELLRDGKKIENIEVESIVPFGYTPNAIQQFPLCETDTIVCLYENGHYAYKNRTLIPEVFGYDFYTEEMVIDGEWRGDNIPNWIGRSKPIFESNKLKYIVYTNSPNKGLYVIDFDKSWSFKDLYFKRGSSTTKLLDGYQNQLLNVEKK